MKIFSIALYFLLLQRYWVYGPYTTWDIIYPIFAMALVLFSLKIGVSLFSFYSLSIMLIIPLFCLVSPLNLTTAQNLLILMPFGVRLERIQFSGNIILLKIFFSLLLLLFFTNTGLTNTGNYAMSASAPFFDSVDAGYFFLLFHVLLYRIYSSSNHSKFFILVLLVFSAVAIVLSGNRFSVGILLVIQAMRLPITYTLVFVILVLMNIESVLSLLGSVPLPAKLSSFLLDSSFANAVVSDSSLKVRFRNLNHVFSMAGSWQYVFGFGDEASWRNFLSVYANKSLDVSAMTLFFTYGIFGLSLYAWLIMRIRNIVGLDYALVVFLFSLTQDVFGNFLYTSSLLAVVILHLKFIGNGESKPSRRD